ncbi:unnamed protein product [Dimorphilus gyrociliatus]|uniref:Uncharacterized protein n=1 Tax=Dimorphilus gyrociliatus TaxID=2664684 RepID=A0A7I8V822_9ANNE|nr:unnamed protein product [Dimorphilus gyrociliatus]
MYIPQAYTANFQVLVRLNNRIIEGRIIKCEVDGFYKVRCDDSINLVQDGDLMPVQPLLMIPLAAFFENHSRSLLNPGLLSEADKYERALSLIERNLLLGAKQLLINKKIKLADIQLERYLTISLAIGMAAYDGMISPEMRKIVMERLVNILTRATNPENVKLIEFVRKTIKALF